MDGSRVPEDISHVPYTQFHVPASALGSRVAFPGFASCISAVSADSFCVPADGSCVPVAYSQYRVPADSSRVPAEHSQSRFPAVDSSHVPAERSQSRFPAVDSSRVSVDGSRNHPQVPADPQATEIPTDHGASCVANLDDSEDENNESDGCQRKSRAARNSKSRGETKPSQLGYYSGAWTDILITARNNYRKAIHTSTDPFPERSVDNLRDAHDLLLEAVGEFRDNGGELDDGQSIFYIHFRNSFVIF